jgi:type IV pilus assembly protein PilY1
MRLGETMKPDPRNRATSRLSLLSLAMAAGLALPLPALPAGVELATTPMTTSTNTTVKPNLMFVLDDSGSMDWDYLPDIAKNFSGQYGFNSNQCNGSYYNPAVTYLPAVNSTGAPLNATPTTFSAAYNDGYDLTAGTTNLSSGFTGGSGSGASGIALPAGPAFYYTYSGTQTTQALKNYFNTSSTFYTECNSSIGSTPGKAVFSKIRLATTPITTITVSGGASGGATITISGVSSRGNVSSITVTGFGRILAATAGGSRSETATSLAGKIVTQINACTAAVTGNCQVAGFSATSSGAVVTIVGPAASVTPVVTTSSATATTTAFPATSTTTVSSITVNGTQLLSPTPATGTSVSALATDIKNKITLGGYSATVTANVVTVTGPSSASLFTPVIISSGVLTLVTDAFPESTPANLQNFANWFSYYSNRMLMMKTGAGLAFNNVTDKYRVGFLTMNNNVSPGIVEANTFDANQKLAWFNKLYASNPANSTPLREVLSRVGQYYAHKFGNVTSYKATITVGGSGSTSVTSITVNGVEITADSSDASTSTGTVARNIANQINAVQVTDFGASVSGNVITITGPASAASFLPIVTNDSGGMTFTPAAFTGTTTTAQLNGISPGDPVQYSCQQNFTILSTDGYWNGPNTYNLANALVGQVDGTAPRPYNDGAQADTTTTTTYTRDSYSTSSTEISGGSNCGGSPTKKRGIDQQQIQSCSVLTVAGVNQPENCTTWSNTGTKSYVSPFTSNSSTCVSSPTLPSPNPSVRAVSGTPVVTPGLVGGTPDTLADVAMYYYQTDLRNPALGNCTGALGNSVCQDNVFISGTDNNQQQHMTTFTLGLGVRGRMVYSSSYLTDTTGDFVAVKLGSTASSTVCTWQTAGTVCNWPVPTAGAPETTDDLWHAAINGRGAYFSATDPVSLSDGLANALTSISSKEGSAAAAATSTLNPVPGNNQAFVASYTTLQWSGNLESRGVNTDTAAVNENADWCVENVAAATCTAPASIVADSSGDTTAYFCVRPNSVVCVGGSLVGTDCKIPVATACVGTMNAKVTDTTDTRIIKTANAAGTALINFDTSYRAANPSYFDATLLAGLSQWPASTDLSAQAVAFRTGAPGDNLINYLRGQHGHEYDRTSVAVIDQFYRNRTAVMGDALESQPAFMGAPVFSYPYPGYAEFLAAQASRPGTVYMGTNDGMMHAIAADTGIERWAYVPSMVIPNMWKLADKQYADKHTNYVNGSPITTDVCTANCANAVNAATPSTNPVWKTILVAGLNGGGRGYFALDITDPTSPALLWEFTTSTGIGAVKDNDLGYTFGQAVVTRKMDGTWVVLLTSGYDNGTDSATRVSGSLVANSPAGSGGGFLYVLNASTGAIISKIATGAGTAAAPSGLGKISGYDAETGGNRASFVYGGDLLGNLWRFDINSATSAAIGTGSALKLAALFSDTSGTLPQPMMTTPILGTILGKRVIFIGTGKYLEVSDLSTTQKQTQYAIKDDDATSTLVNPRNTLVQQFLITNPDGTPTRLSASSATATATGMNPVDFGSGRGWFVDLPDSRERVNIDAQLKEGTLQVPSIVPSSTDCSPGGAGWLNFFDYKTGGAVTTSGVASAKYDSPIVGVNVLFIDGNPVVEVVTSTEPTPQINTGVPFKVSAAGFSGKRMLWRELIPQD